MRQPVQTPEAPSPSGSYSQAIIAGPFVFTAGMGAHDPQTGTVVGQTIEEQTKQTLTNLDAALRATGMSLDDVVKVTAHLQDMERDFAGYDEVYRQFFRAPFPARTTVGSVLTSILVEIDVVAFRPSE